MALRVRSELIKLDVAEDYVAEPIWAVQGEINSLQLLIELYQQGAPIDLENTKVTFKARRSDGYITGWTGENLTSNACEILLPREVFQREGKVHCDITIEDVENSITVKSPMFELQVLPSIED